MTRCRKCDRPARTRGLCPNHYENDRRRHGWESTYIDAQPVRDHIHALRSAGIGNKRISELTGVSHNTIQVILTGRPERGTGPTKQVWRRTAEKLFALTVPDIPHSRVAGGAKVPSVGTRRRLQALVAIGYSRSELCRRLGVQVSNGHRLFLDSHLVVNASTARAVAGLFDELQMKPGSCTRAVNDARRKGWPPPMAWDEDRIDDPAATPDCQPAEKLSIVDRYSELRDLGFSEREILRRLGMRAGALSRQLYRYGIPVTTELSRLAREDRRGSA